MSAFEIIGGKKLQGTIYPQGAKNEALQIISACLMTENELILHNVPDILDVNKLLELLQNLGVRVQKLKKGSFSLQANAINIDIMHDDSFSEQVMALRGSVMIAGPLLARFGKVNIPQPGGDKIGRRRLDTHFSGFEKLGARVNYNSASRSFQVEATKLKGTYLLLDEASVTGTANIVMAACLSEGETTIFNAACEPYLLQLCLMLNRMGAKIEGVGSNLLRITGVKELKGTEHTILPDMIEIGSFIGLAAMTKSDIKIKNVSLQHLGNIPSIFRKLGIHIQIEGDDLHIPSQESYEIESNMDGSILTISDAPWPGFTPDLISIALVTATQAKGSVLIHQKMFESRLFFVDNLINMGAKIILCDPHRATVIGSNHQAPLRGINMVSPDIRAGVALLIAALSAEGKSIIHNINQIDRGYENIDERLIALGADIKRIEI